MCCDCVARHTLRTFATAANCGTADALLSVSTWSIIIGHYNWAHNRKHSVPTLNSQQAYNTRHTTNREFLFLSRVDHCLRMGDRWTSGGRQHDRRSGAILEPGRGCRPRGQTVIRSEWEVAPGVLSVS